MLTSSSLQKHALAWEPLAPALLCVHGAVLLSIGGGIAWQWILVIATGFLALWSFSGFGAGRTALLARSIAIFAIALSLLLSTGGVDSYFLFWYVVLIIVYPLLLTGVQAFALWIATPVAYILVFLVDPDPVPLIVVVARTILITAIGGLGLILKTTIYRYMVEREQIEQALAQSEQYFRALIEHAQDIITVLNRDGTIRYASPSVERILGYRAQDLYAHKLIGLVHPDDVDIVAVHLFRTEDHNTVTPIEARFQHKEGTWRVLEAFSTNLLNDPTVDGVVINSRNVTDRKQLEEQYRQAQKMEAIGQLTTGIAHDFNNLLIPIQGYAELLQLRSAADDPRRVLVDKILFSTERATELIRHLLAFSRKQVVALQVHSLNETVTKMHKILMRILGEDIELQITLESDLWNVLVDPTQIEQIIVNLAVNARDAMPNGGQLVITTTNVIVNNQVEVGNLAMANGPYVCLTIQDSGAGMDEEIMAHMFEPFFTTKEPGKGTGMGLATVYGIAKQNNGSIDVKSVPGEGTIFRIYLPRTDEGSPAPMRPEIQMEILSTGNETILLVEDDPAVRDFVEQVLQAQGYHLLKAAEGEEALQLAVHTIEPIHLLLTDVIMPGMSGKTLAKKMRKLRPDTKVLFISGYDDELIAERGVLDTDISLLPKPFGPAILAHAVRTVLDQ